VREDLRLGLREVARIHPARPWEADWRERQFRRDRKARELFDWAARQGELSPDERERPIIKDYYRTREVLGYNE